MTNLTIITNEAIAQGLFTEEQAQEYFENGYTLPLHTFKEWQRLGYSVKKGEHAKMTCYIWRFNNKKKKQQNDNENDENNQEINEQDFYKVKAFFFTAEQVEKIKTKATA